MPLSSFESKLFTPDSEYNDKTLMHKWYSLMLTIPSDQIGYKEIDGLTALKYTGDMNGLLASLNVAEDFWYPNILINGYNTSTDFKGVETSIILINQTYLSRAYKLMTSKVKK